MGAPADVPDLRRDRLLRLLAEPARQPTRRKVLRSVEPGEDWSWCVIDEVGFVLGGQ
jgi:hypothetical protein